MKWSTNVAAVGAAILGVAFGALSLALVGGMIYMAVGLGVDLDVGLIGGIMLAIAAWAGGVALTCFEYARTQWFGRDRIVLRR